jgi:hypothetical protein
MTIRKTFRRSLMTTAVLTIKNTLLKSAMTTALLALFSIGGALTTTAAEKDVYKDVLRPNGHERSMAAKRADIRACGAANGVGDLDFPKANECMRAHGWVLAHVVPDPRLADDGYDHDIYNDITKKARGDAALNAATDACAGQFGRPTTGTETSSKFKQCMLGHGWQYARTQRTTTPSVASRDDNDLPDSPNDILVFDNMSKQKRGDAELQSDTEYCNQQAGWQDGLPTMAYRTCMQSRGWRFNHLVTPTEWRDPNTGATCRSIMGGEGSAC